MPTLETLVRVLTIFFLLLLFVIFCFGYLLFSLIFNYLITIFVAIKVISSQKKSSLFTNFYLFLFLCLPFFGVLLYLLFGTDFSDNKTLLDYQRQIKKYQKLENYKTTNSLLKTQSISIPEKVFFYNYAQIKQPIYTCPHVKLLKTPYEHILAIEELIKNAKNFIHMEYYIFCDGHVLNYLLDLLKEKIENGVEVKLIVDDLGNFWKLKKKTREKIKKIGIQFKLFNPIFSFSNTWWQCRNHNKLIVVDNERAIYGSCNISDEYYNITSYFFQTSELSVVLEGDIVNSLNVLFLAHWNMSKKTKKVQEFDISLESMHYFKGKKNAPIKDDLTVQLVNSSPLMGDQIIKNNLLQLIYAAKESIIISTPYFFPPKDFIEALKTASLSGVKIKILVPKNADLSNFFLKIHRLLFNELLLANVEIYEYFGFNHEKLTIFDNNIVYFGSYNWDYRALYLNFESVLLIKCEILSNKLKLFMEGQFQNSYMIKKSDLQISEKIISNIFINSFVRIFKPFL